MIKNRTNLNDVLVVDKSIIIEHKTNRVYLMITYSINMLTNHCNFIGCKPNRRSTPAPKVVIKAYT